jgi:hypothetical protein
MKTLLIVCAGLLALNPGAFAQSHSRLGESTPKTAPEPTADYLAIYQDAKRSYDAGRLDEAEQQLQVVLGRYPHYSPAVTLQSMILQQRRSDTSAMLRRKLDGVVIPRVNFKDALVESSLDFLREETRRLDPEKKGINFVLTIPEEIRKRKITLDLVDVSAGDLLKYISEVGGFRYRVERRAVIVYSEDSAKPAAAPAPPASAEPATPLVPVIPGATP